ncbi:hypothetical protein HMPREF9441_02512 [Paraprevotella clara YIT 11840]|uniref:Uncharacterized protein n=1 Tax=Paraprevotella clara YIT 11840 TaxID=762968 RepID=G5ST12_9BACT|nr:hypothetical protein HMPREF9441_02512 [Paraprevotella clara YIT 11840]
MIFLEGAQFAVCPFHCVAKKYPSQEKQEQHIDMWLVLTHLYAVFV